MEAMHGLDSMGETAENVAAEHRISRIDQDAFAWRSQQRAARAVEEGLFEEEIIAVMLAVKGKTRLVAQDEHPRSETTLLDLAALKPAFGKDGSGSVTAGNSAGINDGAAALLMASE